MVAANTILGLLSIAGGAMVVVLSAFIASPGDEPGMPPAAFPILLGILLVILGTCLACHGWRWQKALTADGRQQPSARKEKTMDQIRSVVASRHSLALSGLVLVYFLTFRLIDFRLGSWLFVLAAMAALGAKKKLELALVPVLISGSLYLIFRYGFTVLLPVWG